MGKVDSVKPIGNFYLRPESIGDEEAIVYLRYYIRGRYAKRSTSVVVPPSQWDADKQRVKPSSDRKKNDMANRLNAQLKSFKDKVDKQIEEYEGIFTYDILNQMLKGEFASNGVKNDLKHTRGVISMARSSMPNSAGSQFFIVTDDSTFLDGQYAAFGNVLDGMDVVDKIVKSRVITRSPFGGGKDRPVEPPVMKKVTVETYGVEYPEPTKM